MSVFMMLEMAASADPERKILGTRQQAMTTRELYRAALGGAGLLTRSGARSAAFLGLNGREFAVALFAAAAAGLPFTPVNYRLATAQLRELIGELDCPVVLYDEGLRDVVAGLDRPLVSNSEWVAKATAAAPAEHVEVDDDDHAVVLFTSGTTSKPKRAVLRHRNLLSYVLQTVEFAAAAPEDAFLVTVPPYHVAGVGTLLSNVYAGRRIVILPNFTAPEWLALARQEEVTNAMVVPTMLARIVDELGGKAAGLPALRSLAYGGARMPRTVLETAMKAFDGVDFTNAYGLTETSSTIALLGPDDHRAALTSADPAVRARLGSVGRAVPGVEAEVRGVGGEPLGPGEPGPLWVRGPQVSGAYVGSGSLVDADGWFDTRDNAHIDRDGYIFISGRSDDTIIKGGENIAPAEIEDVLLQHPQVKEAAVVGQPDEHWGARIVAVIVAQPGADLDEETVRGWVRENLRGSRTPDVVYFRAELPYTATGKLLRRELLAEDAR